jgi:hypothetical protein
MEKKIKRKSMTIRYDSRTFKIYPNSHTISLTTVQGILVYPVAHSPFIDKYRGEYTNAHIPQIGQENKGACIHVSY